MVYLYSLCLCACVSIYFAAIWMCVVLHLMLALMLQHLDDLHDDLRTSQYFYFVHIPC